MLSEETKLRASLAGARFHRDEARTERDRLRARLDWLRRAYAELNITRHGLAEVLTSTQRGWQEEARKRHNAEGERDRLRAFVAELCNDCNHPRADHAFRGKPDACAWQHCSCKAYVAEPAALDGSGIMGGSPRDEAHDFTETEMFAGLYPAVKAERDRLRAAVERAVNILFYGAAPSPSRVVAMGNELRAALDGRDVMGGSND